MLKIKYLLIISCLMATSASAAVVVKGIETLSPQEQEVAFGILIQKKHDAENATRINEDLTAAIPAKNLEAYWVPDTLYQVVQTYYDLEGLDDHGGYMAKQAHSPPDLWKESKRISNNFNNMAIKPAKFRYYKYPTTVEEHKAIHPTIIQHWTRFNNVAHAKLEDVHFQTHGSAHALTRVFQTVTLGLQYNDKRGVSHKFDERAKVYCERIRYLKESETFLKHALKVEEQAHQEGKLLLWRYIQPLPGQMTDLPFEIQKGNIEETLNSPLEYRRSHYYGTDGPRISFAARLLDGYFGDGRIHGTPYQRIAVQACTFALIANELAAKKNGYNIIEPIVYSLALSPEKIEELKGKLYLYHPREAMPQHHGIYGTGEGFHPGWLLDYNNKQNTEELLEVMQSEALQVHLINGVLQDDFKNNPEAVRIRHTNNQFFNRTKAEEIAQPKEVVEPQHPVLVVPKQSVPVAPKQSVPVAPKQPIPVAPKQPVSVAPKQPIPVAPLGIAPVVAHVKQVKRTPVHHRQTKATPVRTARVKRTPVHHRQIKATPVRTARVKSVHLRSTRLTAASARGTRLRSTPLRTTRTRSAVVRKKRVSIRRLR